MRKEQYDLPLNLEPSETMSSDSSSSSAIPRSSNDRGKAYDRVKAITERCKRSRQEEHVVATALANRAYHLPGNGYLADLCQYLVNNHLLYGLFCRNPNHPIRNKLRAVNLLGSALFGLAITNLIWIGAIYYNEDPNDVLFKISFQNGSSNEAFYANSTNATGVDVPDFEIVLPGPRDEATAQTLENTLQITKGMVLLWTLGGCLHAIYDSAVWYASACVCCLPGNRCESLGFMRRAGGYFIFFIVVLVSASASFAVVLRMALGDDQRDSDRSVLKSAGLGNNVGKCEFLLSYLVEFLLTLFIYYPLFQLILFSGCLSCLGCWKVPMLGGRPFEMKQLELREQKVVFRGTAV